MTNPRVTDDDKDEISVTLDGRHLRGWSYASDDERRQKMLQAREYVEGWCDRGDGSDVAAAAQANAVREALEFYADPFAWKKKHDPEDVIRVPDFYGETSFGDMAIEALVALASARKPDVPQEPEVPLDLKTDPALLALIERAKNHVMSPEEAYEQRRSFTRGMCPSNRDYKEWCGEVDRLLPPLSDTRPDRSIPAASGASTPDRSRS